MSKIPTEAIEAASEAAHRIYVQDVGQTLATRDLTNAITDAVLAAILPHLAAHDAEAARAARVLPSVEDVAAVLFECLNPGAHWATALVGARRPLSVEAQVVDTHRTAAAAVLALFPDAPSREQVERDAAEKALREAAAEIDWTWETFVANDGITSIREHGKTPGELLRERADRLAAGGDHA